MRWQTPNIKPAKKTGKLFSEDPLKWVALVITFIGIVAWTGGAAYSEGYWSAVGWSKPIIPKTLQETAYTGFTGPIVNWFRASMFILCVAIYVALLEFLSTLPFPKFTRQKNLAKEPSRMAKWFSRRKKFDPAMGRFIALMLVSGVGLSLMFALPSVVWCYAAFVEGKNHIEKAICEARSAKTFHSTVMLGDGKTMSGVIIDRSDNVTILLDRAAIHVIASGEKSVLLDTTNVEQIACAKK